MNGRVVESPQKNNLIVLPATQPPLVSVALSDGLPHSSSTGRRVSISDSNLKKTSPLIQSQNPSTHEKVSDESSGRRMSRFKTPVVTSTVQAAPIISAESDRVFKNEILDHKLPPRPRRASQLESNLEALKAEKMRDNKLFNDSWPLMKRVGWALQWGPTTLQDREMYFVPRGRLQDGVEVLHIAFPLLTLFPHHFPP